jgi:hypothetical protein
MAGVCWHVGSLRSALATFEVTYTLLKAPNKSEDYLYLTFQVPQAKYMDLVFSVR